VKDASAVLAFIYDLRKGYLDHVRATDLLAPLAHDRPDVMFIMGVRKALGHGTERDAELGNDLAVFARRENNPLAFKYSIDLRSLKDMSFEITMLDDQNGHE